MAFREGSGWGESLELKVLDGKTGEVKRWLKVDGSRTIDVKEAYETLIEVIRLTRGEKT